MGTDRNAVRRKLAPRGALGLAAGALLALSAASDVARTAPVEARFQVTDRVLSPGFGPFAATLPGFGAGSDLVWAGSGFEPTVSRTSWIATEDAPDRIVASPADVAWWDTLRPGALDGAQVDVYRVTDGRLERVRSDRIAAGGHQASGWSSALPDNRLVPPGETAFDYAFAPWSRPGAEAWFAVQAVGADGTASAPSAAVRATSPDPIPEPGPPPDLIADPAPTTPPGAAPPPPQDLTAETTASGAVRLSWTGAGPLPAGWRVLISQTPPEAHRGYYGLLEGGTDAAPIRAGDLAILSKTFDRASRRDFHTDRVWNVFGDTALTRQPLVDFFPDEDPARSWRLVPHAPDTPVEEPGETFVEFTLDRGATIRLGGYNYAGAGQHWYPVLEPGRTYVVEVWAKADRPKAIRFAFDGPYGQPGPDYLRPQIQAAGPEWRRLTARFTPKRLLASDWAAWFGVEVDGPGTVAFDNFRIRPEDTPWLALQPRDRARLEAAGVDALRTHGLARTARRTYDLGQLTNPGGVTGIDHGNTLPQSLGAIEGVGADPWLQIEPHLSPEEWLGFVEYLAAPAPAPGEEASRPWAAKRAAQGREAPWSDAFDRIYLEIGNETWNGLFAPWTFQGMPDAATGAWLSRGAVYGLFQEQVIRSLRASPWWESAGLEDKVVFVLGGWGGTSYGRDAAAASSSSDLLTIAAYNGGWDAGKGPPQATPQGFFEVLGDVSQSAIPDADRLAAEAAEIGRARGRPLAIGTYEAGPGYALDGLNGDRVTEEQAAEQERVMKSAAAGAATLDAFLARAERGFGVQNFFTFGEGRYWTSHARSIEGGAAHPAWDLLARTGAVGRGEMLAVETLAVPRADIPATAWRAAVAEAPLVGAHAARDGDRLTLTLVSRRVPGWPEGAGDGTAAVTVDLPFATAARATRHRLTGDYRSTNILAPEAELVAEPLPEGWLSPGRLSVPALPPGAVEIYVFEGIGDG